MGKRCILTHSFGFRCRRLMQSLGMQEEAEDAAGRQKERDEIAL